MPFAVKNQPEKNHWFHRDIDAMCHQLNTDPIFIDADRSMKFTITIKLNFLSSYVSWGDFFIPAVHLLGDKQSRVQPLRNKC